MLEKRNLMQTNKIVKFSEDKRRKCNFIHFRESLKKFLPLHFITVKLEFNYNMK